MASKEQLQLIKQKVSFWNQWRIEKPDIKPDLSNVDLRGVFLGEANLSRANLCNSNLNYVNLSDAKLVYANLTGANLSFAYLRDANLSSANLTNADLSDTNLTRSSFNDANLNGANLYHAKLYQTDLSGANLKDANFDSVTINSVQFGNNDLSSIKGLDNILHLGPSIIGIDTIYNSKGNIPEKFLRGAGVPENFISYMSSLTGKAFEFYSCFISYSSKDQVFAERLHADLQDNGVRCWFAPEDLKIGDRTRIAIDESIRKHDKLLLILSQESVASEWVEQEVETAISKEREQKRIVLFPIRLDDKVIEIKSGWPALIKNTRNIGDFRLWKDHDFYIKSFARLIRDLKAEQLDQDHT